MLRLLFSERGQVGDLADPDTTGNGQDPDQSAAPEPEDPTADGDDKKATESFVDPDALPEELRNSKDFKSMQATFTRKMQDIRANKDKIEAFDRLNSDPNYARDFLNQMARNLGVSIADGTPKSAPKAAEKAPAEYVEAVKEILPPELNWMADSLAQAQWALNKMSVEPIVQSQNRERLAQRQQEYQKLVGELTESVPDWEERESEMAEVLKFLNSDNLNHPKFGSKLTLLYNLVTGNQAATLEASKRMRDTARSRTSRSSSTSRTDSNLPELVRSAKSDQDAFQLAMKAALEEVQKGRR